MSRAKLSVCMICKDEQVLLPGALDSLRGVADEIVVAIDDRTTDFTESVARRYGANIRKFTWSDSFSEARNISLAAATRDWILVIDADDRLTGYGQFLIKETLRRNRKDVQGYAFQIEEWALSGRKMQTGWSSVRMFPNHADFRYRGRVHEQVWWRGKPLRLKARLEGTAIVHVGYDPIIWEQRGKWTRNLELLRREVQERPNDPFPLYNLARQYVGTNADLAAAYATQALSAGSGLYPEQVEEMTCLVNPGGLRAEDGQRTTPIA